LSLGAMSQYCGFFHVGGPSSDFFYLLLLYKSYKNYINRVHEKQNSARCNQISTVHSVEIISLTSESWKKFSAI